MVENNCRVTFYNLSRADVNALVRAAHNIIGDYWMRRVDIVPTAAQWYVECRPTADSTTWITLYGPWEESNAEQFCHMWNAKAGFERYRARPAMTEQH